MTLATGGTKLRASVLYGGLVAAFLVVAIDPARADSTERIDLETNGGQLATLHGFVLSRDGHFAFVAGQTKDPRATCDTFFVRDLTTGHTSCARLNLPARFGVAVRLAGASFSGRFVLLQVQPERNTGALLIWDRDTGETDQIDIHPDGLPSDEPGPAAVSADGRFVAFTAARRRPDETEPRCVEGVSRCNDVYLRDRARQTTERVSVAWRGGDPDGSSGDPSVSDDGRFVAFGSTAGDIVPGNAKACDSEPIAVRCTPDVSLWDRHRGASIKVIKPSGFRRRNTGARGVLDPSGRFVDYVVALPTTVSESAGGQRLYRYDVARRTTRFLFRAPDEGIVDLPVSADARFVAFAAPYLGPPYMFLGLEVRNRVQGLFLRDRFAGSVRQIDVAPDGSPPMSSRLTAVGTPARPTVDFAGISASGGVVAFTSDAANLVMDDTNGTTDAFVRYIDGAMPRSGTQPESAGW